MVVFAGFEKMDGQRDGWMEGRMDEWMDGLTLIILDWIANSFQSARMGFACYGRMDYR